MTHKSLKKIAVSKKTKSKSKSKSKSKKSSHNHKSSRHVHNTVGGVCTCGYPLTSLGSGLKVCKVCNIGSPSINRPGLFGLPGLFGSKKRSKKHRKSRRSHKFGLETEYGAGYKGYDYPGVFSNYFGYQNPFINRPIWDNPIATVDGVKVGVVPQMLQSYSS